MGWGRPAHTVAYSRKGQFLRQSSYGLSGGVGGDFRPVGRREALGGGFCAIQRLGRAPAGRQRQIGVKELAGEPSKEERKSVVSGNGVSGRVGHGDRRKNKNQKSNRGKPNKRLSKT